MRSMALLCEDLKAAGNDFLPVGSLTQDCLENFFSTLQDTAGHRDNNTCSEFPSAFASALVRCLTRSVKGKNCRDDNALNLLHLQQLYDAAEKAYKAAKAAAAAADRQAAEREAAEREAAALAESTNASAPAIHPAASEPTAASSADDERNNAYEPLAYLLDGSDSEAEEEDEDWDQYEEEEEPLDPELQVNNGTFHAQLQQQMGSINAARTAVPIVAQYLRGTACEDCAALLRGEFQFPLHLPDTLTASTSALENAKLPSRHLPPVLHEEKVLGKLMDIIMTLPQIRKF